jgi:hypothetical protein
MTQLLTSALPTSDPITITSNLAIWLPWGSPADSGRNVFYATNGVDDALAGKDSVTQFRGTFLGPDSIEFFYFNSLIGLSGLFVRSA